METLENRQLLANFPVTSTADSGPGTLRARIEAANAAGGANTVVVPAGTYTLTSDFLTIASNMTISGAGAGTTIIDGNGTHGTDYDVFDVTTNTGSVTANFSGLTIQDVASGSDGINADQNVVRT